MKSIIPQQTVAPDAPPAPLQVAKNAADRTKARRNPLRIDLATAPGGGTPASGVNV